MALDVQTLGRGSEKERVCADILIYGRSGAGKTYEAATAPKPYIMSPDPTGHKSVPYAIPGKITRKIDDIREVINGFYQGGHGYKTLIIDGLSFIHDMYVREIGQYFHDNMGAKDPDLMPIQGRMKILNQYRAFLRAAVDLTQVDPPEDRVHVVFTTLEERLKEADEAPFTIRPLFGSNKMNEQFPAFFSVVTYITPSGTEDDEGNPDTTRYMLFTESKGILARDRLGIFPSKGVAPNLSKYLK